MSIDLPNPPQPRELVQRRAQKAMLDAEVQVNAWFLTVVAPRTGRYLARRRFLPLAVIRADGRHARRLTLVERLRLATAGLFGAH